MLLKEEWGCGFLPQQLLVCMFCPTANINPTLNYCISMGFQVVAMEEHLECYFCSSCRREVSFVMGLTILVHRAYWNLIPAQVKTVLLPITYKICDNVKLSTVFPSFKYFCFRRLWHIYVWYMNAWTSLSPSSIMCLLWQRRSRMKLVCKLLM